MTQQIINYHRIEKAIGYLTDNFKSQPDLDEIARAAYLSPFHFQRIFRDWVEISPKNFLQYLTVDYLQKKIKETENMIEAADIAGLSGQSRVDNLFVSIEGVSAHQFKNAGAGLEIFYGYHASPFGMCFIGVAEKRICTLKFIDEEEKRNEFRQFSEQWHFAKLIHKPEFTQLYIRKIFQHDETNPEKLHLLVQGTRFQIKVWETLIKIPFGSVSSFQTIANMIDEPNAARSVGSAVGANSILYLIPCHRIISKEGIMGNYHWGRVRKQATIGWEISRANY